MGWSRQPAEEDTGTQIIYSTRERVLSVPAEVTSCEGEGRGVAMGAEACILAVVWGAPARVLLWWGTLWSQGFGWTCVECLPFADWIPASRVDPGVVRQRVCFSFVRQEAPPAPTFVSPASSGTLSPEKPGLPSSTVRP